MRLRKAMVLAAFWVFASVQAQQAGVKLFREGAFNETDVVRALVPVSPDERSRNIVLKPGARPATGRPAPGQAGSGSTPLLITFETNSAELTAEARTGLDIVGKALSSDRLANFTFSIEGHADPRGGEDLNLHLSERRAESVKQYLTQAHSISPDRLRPIGKGDTELMNKQSPTAPENRRVTIKTLGPKQ